MNYKALVTDPYNHNDKHFITYDYPSKKEFIRDIRANGYKVSDKNVKPERVYDFLIDNYDGDDLIWAYLTVKDLDALEAGKVTRFDLEEKASQKFWKASERRMARIDAKSAQLDKV